MKIDWNLPLKEREENQNSLNAFDLIVAADVIFDNSLFRPLCQTLTSLFNRCKNCKQFLLVNAVRNINTKQEFLDLLRKLKVLKTHISNINMYKNYYLLQYLSHFSSENYNFTYEERQLTQPNFLHWEQSDISPVKIYLIKRI